jgi:hypothetical protein
VPVAIKAAPNILSLIGHGTLAPSRPIGRFWH